LRALRAALILALALAPEAPAQTASSDLKELMQAFAGVKRSSARFLERRYLHVLKTPLETSGVLLYVAPAYLLKETEKPQHELLVVDANQLTIDRDGKSQRLSRDEYPQIWAFVEGIRATLAGDLMQLEAVYTVTLEGTAADWRLLLKPRDPAMQQLVEEIRLSGAGPHIKRVETSEHDGDRSEMSITENPP
jgi:outer membrane lipoprotein carrier protein LolA